MYMVDAQLYLHLFDMQRSPPKIDSNPKTKKKARLCVFNSFPPPFSDGYNCDYFLRTIDISKSTLSVHTQ